MHKLQRNTNAICVQWLRITGQLLNVRSDETKVGITEVLGRMTIDATLGTKPTGQEAEYTLRARENYKIVEADDRSAEVL